MNNNNDVQAPSGAITRFLNTIERVGNKLPDPAIIFLVAMLLSYKPQAIRLICPKSLCGFSGG